MLGICALFSTAVRLRAGNKQKYKTPIDSGSNGNARKYRQHRSICNIVSSQAHFANVFTSSSVLQENAGAIQIALSAGGGFPSVQRVGNVQFLRVDYFKRVLGVAMPLLATDCLAQTWCYLLYHFRGHRPKPGLRWGSPQAVRTTYGNVLEHDDKGRRQWPVGSA